MELFNLLAKLTLDSSEFTKALDQAQSEADSFSPPEDQNLELDNSEYTDSLGEAERESDLFSDRVQGTFANLKGVLAGLGIAGVIAGIVSTLKDGVDLARTHGDTIDKQSQKMGISAKEYQEWSYALELSGASIDDLNRGLRTWQQAAGDEEAVAKLSDAFSALGIDAEDAFKKIEKGENLDDLLNQVMYGLADKSEGDRGWIAEALFGRNATQLNALLNQTSDQIKDAKQESEDLGMVMSDEAVKAAADYNDAVTRMEGALNGIKEAFAESLLPVLTDAANTIAKIVAFFNPRTKQQSLSDMFADDDKQFAETLVDIEGTAAAAETLADKLLAMGDTSKMTAEQYEIWKGTAETLIGLVPSLSEVIDTETGEIKANSDEIKENIKQWENLAKQKALQTLKEEKYSEIVQKNKDLIDQTVEANKKAGETENARVSSLSNLNKILKENGQEALSDNATLEDVFAAQTKLVTDNPDNTQLQIQFANALGEWTSANQKAIEAQAEADKLAEELKKGEEEYQTWLKSAEEMYGTLGTDADDAITKATDLGKALGDLPTKKRIILEMYQDSHSHAIGSAYVPYDNYPALLHRGEKVLTATEARQQSNNGVDLSSLGDSITAAIKNGMTGVTVNSYLNGRSITAEVNRNNTNDLKSRRYRA